MLGSNGEKLCLRTAGGQIQDKGDYCSNPVGPGGCGDSYWLAAAFAASAAKIVAANQPDCMGGTGPTDAGGQ
jgi:hypothetical protein